MSENTFATSQSSHENDDEGKDGYGGCYEQALEAEITKLKLEIIEEKRMLLMLEKFLIWR